MLGSACLRLRSRRGLHPAAWSFPGRCPCAPGRERDRDAPRVLSRGRSLGPTGQHARLLSPRATTGTLPALPREGLSPARRSSGRWRSSRTDYAGCGTERQASPNAGSGVQGLGFVGRTGLWVRTEKITTKVTKGTKQTTGFSLQASGSEWVGLGRGFGLKTSPRRTRRARRSEDSLSTDGCRWPQMDWVVKGL
jgi:hypothetical protein